MTTCLKKKKRYGGNASRLFYRGLILFIAPLVFLAALEQAQAEPEYRLVGVVKGKDFIGAVLEDGQSGQTLYRLREQLPDGSTISRIVHDSVTIRQNDGASYELFIVQSAKPSSVKGGPPASRPNTSLGRPGQPAVNRAAPAIRAQERGQDGQPQRRGKRRILRRK